MLMQIQAVLGTKIDEKRTLVGEGLETIGWCGYNQIVVSIEIEIEYQQAVTKSGIVLVIGWLDGAHIWCFIHINCASKRCRTTVNHVNKTRKEVIPRSTSNDVIKAIFFFFFPLM